MRLAVATVVLDINGVLGTVSFCDICRFQVDEGLNVVISKRPE